MLCKPDSGRFTNDNKTVANEKNTRLQLLTFVLINELMVISGSDIHLLKVFDCVVRNRGFTAAQIELGLSQPTISNHITALEERLGISLCQRGRRGFLLTEKGKIVHQISQNLLSAINENSVRLGELKGNLVGHLKVAIVDCIASDPNMKLPEVVEQLNLIAPAISLELSTESPQDVLTKVLDGQAHIGIGSFDNQIQGLDYKNLYEETHSLYCGKNHPLRDVPADKIKSCNIDEHNWVHRGYWSKQRRRALKANDSDRVVQGIETQIIMILSGQYIGLLPDHQAGSFVRNNRLYLLDVGQDHYQCTMQMVTQTGRKPLTIETFCKILLNLTIV